MDSLGAGASCTERPGGRLRKSDGEPLCCDVQLTTSAPRSQLSAAHGRASHCGGRQRTTATTSISMLLGLLICYESAISNWSGEHSLNSTDLDHPNCANTILVMI